MILFVISYGSPIQQPSVTELYRVLQVVVLQQEIP